MWMPDFPRRDLEKLRARTHCSTPGCSVETPCNGCVYTGVGLAENVPPTQANIEVAFAYVEEMHAKGYLDDREKARETHRLLRLIPVVTP